MSSPPPSEDALAAALRSGEAAALDKPAATPPADEAWGERKVIPIKIARELFCRRVVDAIPAGELYQLGRYKNYVIAWEIKSGSRRGELYIDHITEETFSSWIDQFCYFVQDPKKSFESQPRTSISGAQSRTVMESQAMQQTIPLIEERLDVRLPRRIIKNGKTHFEPVPLGYDIDTGIYTTDAHDIDWSGPKMSKEEIRKTILHDLAEFPLDGMSPPNITSRSVSAVVTGMLSQFLRLSLPKKQGLLFVANQPGSGKSFCAAYTFAPVCGPQAALSYPDSEEERRKSFMTAADAGKTVAFLDDVKSLESTALNRFLTNATITDRKIGTGEQLEIPNKMQFFITGNNLKTSKDLERRLLPVDIFEEGDPVSKTYAGNVAEWMFSDPTWRRDRRQLLWDMVRYWEEAGCPRHVRPIPSFEDFSICADIAVNCGFADPYGARMVTLDTGDARSAAMADILAVAAGLITRHPDGGLGKNLLVDIYQTTAAAEDAQAARGDCHVARLDHLDDEHMDIITKHARETDYTARELLADYERNGDVGLYADFDGRDLLALARAEYKDGIILNAKENASEKGAASALGRLFQKFKGRVLRDTFGRLYLIGSRRTSAATRYRFTILSPRSAAIPTPIANDGTAPDDSEPF